MLIKKGKILESKFLVLCKNRELVISKILSMNY